MWDGSNWTFAKANVRTYNMQLQWEQKLAIFHFRCVSRVSDSGALLSMVANLQWTTVNNLPITLLTKLTAFALIWTPELEY